jgi:NhaP-type Na+/H+ or K+/H+ antiporter
MDEGSLVLQSITLAMAAGVFCQLLADWLKVPSIFFYLLVGVLLGPAYAGMIDPNEIGTGLMTIIEIGVALILFEGALSLQLDQFRRISGPIRRLLTLGTCITFVGCTCAAWFIVGLPIHYSLIFGALMTITGPTVIGPILKRLPLRQNISTVLNWESILLDPIGAILAILIMEFILAKDLSIMNTVIQFFRIFFVGGGVGFLAGYVMRFTLKRISAFSNENVNLFILAGALISFQGADLLAEHSGLLAVVAAGFVLANADLSQKGEILEFKSTLSTFLVGFLFVLLAAKLNIDQVLGFGERGWWLLAAVLVLIRPLNVFLSIRGKGLSFREKLFIAWLAPRGIVVASTASLFALIFASHGDQQAYQLESLTYLVIVATVILQGLPAGLFARLLGVRETEKTGTLIVGGHILPRKIGLWLQDKGLEVKIVDTNFWEVREAQREGLEAHRGNSLDPVFLRNLQIQRIGTLIALTSNDEVNLLAAQIGRKLFGEKGSYQIMPHRSEITHELSKELGGKPILPQFPYMEEIDVGFKEDRYKWTEVLVPKGTIFDGPIMVKGKKFWPVFFCQFPPLQIVEVKHTFKSDNLVAGVMEK